MNAKTLKALKASIEHWRRLRDNRFCGEYAGQDDCPLCQLFAAGFAKHRCRGCPIDDKTKRNCRNSPYTKAHSAFHNDALSETAWRKTAQAEIDFLKSLLPKRKKAKP